MRYIYIYVQLPCLLQKTLATTFSVKVTSSHDAMLCELRAYTRTRYDNTWLAYELLL